MVASEDVERLMKLAQELYEEALAHHDPVAEDVNERAKPLTPTDEEAFTANPILVKALAFIVKQALPRVISSLSGGAISPVFSQAIIQLASTVCAGKENPDPSFTEIRERLDEIKKATQEIKDLIVRQPKITEIEKIQDEIAGYWEQIMDACKQGDMAAAFEVIHDVGTKPNLQSRLHTFRNTLFQNGIDMEVGLAPELRKFYDGRLADTGEWVSFDITNYCAHIFNWYSVTARTYRLGTALQILYEHCRGSTPSIRETRCKDFSQANEDVQDRLRKVFGVDANDNLVDYGAAKLLLDAAAIDLNLHFPPLYELRVVGGRSMSIHYTNDYRHRKYRLLEYDGELPVRKAILLEFNKATGFWYLRAARSPGYMQLPREDLTPRMEWQRLRAQDETPYLDEESDDKPNSNHDAIFQLIPLKNAAQQAKLVLVKEGKSALRTWDIEFSPSNFKYTALGSDDLARAHWDHFRPHVQDHERGMTVCCPINNNTSDLTLVLDYAWSNGFYYYANYVWAPGDSYSVAAWMGDLEAKFRFAIYRVHAQGDIRDIIHRTFGPQALPHLGLPALNVQEKTLVGYLHLRLTVPTIGKASISAYQSDVNEPHWDGHGDNLIRSGRKEMMWSQMKGEFFMDSSPNALARLELYSK